jgi:hypothetical protein
MLLTFQSDGVLRVYDSVEDAVRAVEPLDAEEVFRAVFDETGEVYGIEWIRPNERGRLLPFVVASGEYTLAPQRRKDVTGLVQALREAQAIEPPDVHARLRLLESRLSGVDA